MNYFVRHWRGELSLPVSYWLNTVGASISMVTLGGLYFYLRDIGEMPGNPQLDSMVSFAPLCVYIWSIVGAWRSAERYRAERSKEKRSAYWGVIAQLALIAGGMKTVVEQIIKSLS